MNDLPSFIKQQTLHPLSDVQQSRTPISSQFIYIVFMVVLGASAISLPFIYTSISVKASAIVRPNAEISIIRSLVNGRVKESFVHENHFVKKNEILYTLESEIIAEKERYLNEKVQDLQHLIADLKSLLNPDVKDLNLKTPLYQQASFSYKQKITEATTRYLKVKAAYDRNLKLHQQKVIADAEFENYKFELDKTQQERALVRQSQLSAWQNELKNYQNELFDNKAQHNQLLKEKENLVIRAPISGTIQKLAGLYQGSVIFVNQDLAQISPNTALIVEAYISPNDIGFLQTNMPVRFQVDAFNYNQWGLATGKVLEISNDIHIVNERPVFKVRCIVDKDYLELKNGYKGYLKKGMTLQARFIVTERSLWQLLFDKVDDWLNPNLSQKPS